MHQEFRIFISSTFRDLQAERDVLLRTVFPRIRQVCRERGVTFTEIDLRWGVTEEEAVLGRVIRACMEEIDRCAPYFIGILGSRYGWSPRLHEVQKDGDLLRDYPWIEDAVLEGQSLLALEFTQGILNRPPSHESIVLYRDSQEQPVDPRDADRLTALRERVAAHGCTVRSFADPREFGGTILRHLLYIIERDFPAHEASSPLHDVRRGQEAFAASRRQAYIADPASLSQLTRHADEGGPPLVVAAPSGYGKSALLAYWADWYQRKHPDAFVVTHFIGVGAKGTDRAAVMRHCMMEIKERFALTDVIPEAGAALEEEFPLWLARVRGTPMILVIDAINQLHAETEPVWLPQFLPPDIRLIVSCTPGPVATALAARGWNVMSLATLPVDLREALIVRFLGEYRKGLNAQQCKRIAAEPMSAVPLFLRTLLEELRLSGSFENLDAGIEHYLSATTLEDLFQLVLARMEQDHGVDAVRRVLCAVWAARRGLQADEIAAAADIAPGTVAVLMQAFEYHMLWRDGLRTFFHEYLRDAVEARYLSTDAARRSAHSHLGACFAARTLDARRADEEAWQWQQAEQWGELRQCLVSMPMFILQYSADTAHELFGYWLALGERADMVSEYTDAMERYRQHHPDRAQIATVCQNLGNYFLVCSKLEAAVRMMDLAYENASAVHGADNLRTTEFLVDVGTAHYHLGQLDAAEQAWRRVLQIQERELPPDHPAICESLNNLTALLYARGQYADAEITARKSIEVGERTEAEHSFAMSDRLSNLASVLTQLNRLTDALDTMERALAIRLAILGDRHPEVARMMNNLGVIGARVRGSAYAEEVFRKALDILLPTVGVYHEYPCRSYSNLANQLARDGRHAEAHENFDRALEICRVIYGPDHLQTLTVRCDRASLLHAEGKNDDAAREFAEALPRRCSLEGDRHPKCQEAIAQYVEVLTAVHDETGAAEWSARISR